MSAWTTEGITGGSPWGGSKAGVTCPADAELVRDVSYWLIPDQSARDSWCATQLASRGFERDMGGCWDGKAGETDHQRGRLACWVVNERPRFLWTDEPEGIYGVLTGDWISTMRESRIRTFRRIATWWSESAVRGGTRPVFDGSEESLLDLVHPGIVPACVPYPYVDLDGYIAGEYFPQGDIAAILCLPAEVGTSDVAYFLFSEVPTLDAWFDERVGAARVDGGKQGCWNGESGLPEWDHGRLACFIGSGSGVAHLRWTDIGSLVYGSLVGTDRDIQELYEWWTVHRSEGASIESPASSAGPRATSGAPTPAHVREIPPPSRMASSPVPGPVPSSDGRPRPSPAVR